MCTLDWLGIKNPYVWPKNHPISEINQGQNLKMTTNTYFLYLKKSYDFEMVKNDQEHNLWVICGKKRHLQDFLFLPIFSLTVKKCKLAAHIDFFLFST